MRTARSDLLVLLVPLELTERQDQQGRSVHQGRPVWRVPSALRAHRVPPAQRELEVRTELQAPSVQPAQQDLEVRTELRAPSVQPAQRDLEVRKELQAHLVRRGCLEKRVLLVRLGQQAWPDQQERRVHLD